MGTAYVLGESGKEIKGGQRLDAEITYLKLRGIALRQFPDIVASVSLTHGPLYVAKSLRIFLHDGSFLEIWLSEAKYSYHWQRTDGMVYRHDNAPHSKHKHIRTFPKHFHDGSEEKVAESSIDDDPESALEEFLLFIKNKIGSD